MFPAFPLVHTSYALPAEEQYISSSSLVFPPRLSRSSPLPLHLHEPLIRYSFKLGLHTQNTVPLYDSQISLCTHTTPSSLPSLAYAKPILPELMYLPLGPDASLRFTTSFAEPQVPSFADALHHHINAQNALAEAINTAQRHRHLAEMDGFATSKPFAMHINQQSLSSPQHSTFPALTRREDSSTHEMASSAALTRADAALQWFRPLFTASHTLGGEIQGNFICSRFSPYIPVRVDTADQYPPCSDPSTYGAPYQDLLSVNHAMTDTQESRFGNVHEVGNNHFDEEDIPGNSLAPDSENRTRVPAPRPPVSTQSGNKLTENSLPVRVAWRYVEMCYTCNVLMTICSACAQHCHRGHRLGPVLTHTVGGVGMVAHIRDVDASVDVCVVQNGKKCETRKNPVSGIPNSGSAVSQSPCSATGCRSHDDARMTDDESDEAHGAQGNPTIAANDAVGVEDEDAAADAAITENSVADAGMSDEDAVVRSSDNDNDSNASEDSDAAARMASDNAASAAARSVQRPEDAVEGVLGSPPPCMCGHAGVRWVQ